MLIYSFATEDGPSWYKIFYLNEKIFQIHKFLKVVFALSEREKALDQVKAGSYLAYFGIWFGAAWKVL